MATGTEKNIPQTKLSGGGCYCWVIMFCSMGCQTLSMGALICNAILMVVFTEAFGASKAVTGLAGSVFYIAFSLSGVFLGTLVEKYGARVVCMTGSLLATAGLVVTSFSPNMYMVFLGFGVLGGIGCCSMHVSSVVVVQQYFDKNRAFAAGVASMGQGMGALTVGPFYAILIDIYGWRGAVTIHAACVLQAAVLGAMYFPLPRAQREDSHTCKAEKDKTSASTTNSLKSKKEHHRSNFSFLRENPFVFFTLGYILMSFGNNVMYQFTPSRVSFLGMTKMEAGLLVSVLGLFSTVTRLANSVVANLPCTNLLLEISLTTLAGGVLACLFNVCKVFTSCAVVAACYGVTMGVVYSLEMTVLHNIVGRDRVAKATGVYTTLRGLASLACLPFLGWLFDISQTYDISYYAGGCLQIVGGFSLIGVFFLSRKQDLEIVVEEDIEASQSEAESVNEHPLTPGLIGLNKIKDRILYSHTSSCPDILYGSTPSILGL